MELINGKELSLKIGEEIKMEVNEVIEKLGRPPHLVAVLVGDDPASKSYVTSKEKSCQRVGFKSTIMRIDASISQNDLLKIVDDLNNDDEVDGFIVQLPLPDHLDEISIKTAILPEKDVDGFHPMNLGKMMAGLPGHLPATPKGIITMLEGYGIETSGKNCVIIGRSDIVGTPMSILMSRNKYPGNTTVTLTHSKTSHLAGVVRNADIIIAAIGRPHFVTADMVKRGAVVIDVGINRVEDASKKRGYALVGDVDFENVAPLCSYITPVPGGVGPMTVISLMENTLNSAKTKM